MGTNRGKCPLTIKMVTDQERQLRVIRARIPCMKIIDSRQFGKITRTKKGWWAKAKLRSTRKPKGKVKGKPRGKGGDQEE